jgi:hypothetical protein
MLSGVQCRFCRQIRLLFAAINNELPAVETPLVRQLPCKPVLAAPLNLCFIVSDLILRRTVRGRQ